VPSGLNATALTPGEPGGEPGSAGLATAAGAPARPEIGTAARRARKPVITVRRQYRLRQ
jgi:hypothetical protein